MGIYEWVTSLTGSWGPPLLSVYQANALWINGCAILYGLVLVLSWQNMDRIADSLVRQIVAQVPSTSAGRRQAPRRVRLRTLRLSWEEALSQGRFPFIARQSDFVPRRFTPENVRSLITAQYLIKRSASRLRRLGIELEA
jgi:hypothetical protein